ncbi:MAG: hypothetical protein AABZ67_09585 [Pseudomonadota bacterium]
MHCAGRIGVIAATLGVLAGCAVSPSRIPVEVVGALSQEQQHCVEFFRQVDEAVADAGAGDGMAARISGYPQLRVDRFLASYAQQPMSDAEFADWLSRLLKLGAAAHGVELMNLPADESARLAQRLRNLPPALRQAAVGVKACGNRLNAVIYGSMEERRKLRAAARVPDEYRTWLRIAGLYWVSRIPFAAGVGRWQQAVQKAFDVPLPKLPLRGSLVRYEPPSAATPAIAAVSADASAFPLGIPEPRGADLERLFAAFAPEFIIDTAGDADRPGALGWSDGPIPAVDISQPVVYRRISHARYQDRVLLQLNYSVWFPERPLASEWDLLGGHLDGMIWRVTLTPDGEPWVYDSIHHCGCYHQFFPTARAVPRPQPATLDETAFIPQTLPAITAGTRLSLLLESGTHYLQRITTTHAEDAQSVHYAFADDDSLRSRPAAGGARKSVFRPDGIVPGSERGERYWFWPMGIPEPGAMRQWGRHATAFVGRRHFDDPGLLEKYFRMSQQ